MDNEKKLKVSAWLAASLLLTGCTNSAEAVKALEKSCAQPLSAELYIGSFYSSLTLRCDAVKPPKQDNATGYQG